MAVLGLFWGLFGVDRPDRDFGPIGRVKNTIKKGQKPSKRSKKGSKMSVFLIIVGCTWASVLAAFFRLLILME